MVSVLLAFGVWLAGLAALFFVGMHNLIWWGVVFVVLAALTTWKEVKLSGARRVFLAQLSFVFSLFGKAMLAVGITQLWNLQTGGSFLLMSVIAVLSYPIFRQKMDRFLTTLAAVSVGAGWLIQTLGQAWTPWISPVIFAVSYAIFLSEKENFQPLAWALLFAAFGLGLMTAFSDVMVLFGALNGVLLGAILCGFYGWKSRQNFSLLVAILILALAYIGNMGILMGAALLALGFAQKRIYIKVVGAAVFAGALFWLYYQMQTTLLVKSYYLSATGLVLLGVYAWLKRGKYAR